MSLHNLAKHVQHSGRGKDTQLVHMTPREVQGLRALAQAKGGDLSINPNTGLPEAGFLEDILPVVAAGAAMYFTGGAAAAALGPAGLGLGATTAGILGGAGAGALIGGGMAAIQGGDVGKSALMGGLAGGIGGGMGLGSGQEAVTTGMEGVGGGTSATAANVPLQQATTVGTAPVQINPSTGMGIDPLTGATNVPSGGVGPGSGNVPAGQMTQAMPPSSVTSAPGYMQPAPNPYNLDANQLATQTQGFTGDVAGYSAPAPSGATPPPAADKGFWDGLSPLQKAGVSVAGAGLLASAMANPNTTTAPTEDYTSPLKRISPNFRAQAPIQPNPYYRAQYPVYAAKGGIMSVYQDGGPVERMTQNMMGGQGNMYPQSQQEHTNFATPTQMPASAEVIRSDYDAKTDPYRGVMMASGGISSLGGYSDGGQLLKGPGDGVSDSIPASIANKQPARLADGEFVVPARIVSELGNGSTDAGARKLYAMMDRVQSARKKSIGKGKVAANTKADKLLPA